jgi:hypothetical protein
MNYRALFVVLGIFLSSQVAVQAEPKAYEVVKYSGKAGGATIALDFADGYVGASEIRISQGGKTTTFRLDNSGQMRFVPARGSGQGAISSVSLKMSPDDSAPAKVAGSFASGGKAVAFTLALKK